jgi:hypothetical protein
MLCGGVKKLSYFHRLVRSIAIILFVLLTAVLTPVHSLEVGPEVEWSRTLGGPYGDGSWSLQETKDEGYILVGNTATLGEGSDLWLIKTDREGNPLWNKTFGGSGEDIGYFVHETRNNGYIITGSTESYGIGEERLWLIKTDGNGSKSWTRIYGGFVSSSGDGGWSLDETKDGGYIVTGYTQSRGLGRKDLWLLQIDDQGNEEWDRTYGGTEDDAGMSVVQTRDDGYIVAGRTASFGKGGDDVWLLKMDSRGKEVWNTTFGGIKDDAAFQVVELIDGYALVGRTESGPDKMRIILIKTNLDGKKVWERAYKGSAGTSLQQTSDGGFIIIGRIDNEESGRDALVIKTNSIGREEWALPLGGERDDIGTSIVESRDGSYVLAGITSSEGQGAEDAWLVKLRTEDKNLTDAVDMQNATTSMDRKVVESKFALNVAYTNTSNMSSNITADIDANVVGIGISNRNSEKKSIELAEGNDPNASRRLSDIEKIFKDRLR